MKLDATVEEEIDIEEIPEAVKQKIIDAEKEEQEAMEKINKKKEEAISEPLLDPWIFEEVKEKVEIVPLTLEMPKQKEPKQLSEEEKKLLNSTSSNQAIKTTDQELDDSLMNLQ